MVTGTALPSVVIGTALTGMVPVDSGVAFEVLEWEPGVVIQGQEFLVDRAAPDLATDTVLLVKWNLSNARRPRRRMESDPWIEPGQRRFVAGVLREPEHWANGIPTIDVSQLSFPDPKHHFLEEVKDPNEVMTADEVFEFCSLPVDMTIVRAGTWDREIAPMTWARENGDLWKKIPARRHLLAWADQIETQRARKVPADVAGTYSARLNLPSGRELKFFLRTSEKVASAWNSPKRGEFQGPPWEYRKHGYTISFWLALERAHLPFAQGGPGDVSCRNTLRFPLFGEKPSPTDPDCLDPGYNWAVEYPGGTGERDSSWPAAALYYFFGEDEEVVALLDQYPANWARWYAEAQLQVVTETLLSADGEVQLHKAIHFGDGTSLTLTLERVSHEVVKEPPREGASTW